MTTALNNVVALPQPDLREVYVRAFASLRALASIKEKLESALTAAKAKWKDEQTAATKEYREPIRDEFETIVGKEIDLDAKDKATAAMKTAYAKKFVDVVRGVKKHDDIKAQATAGKESYKTRIDKIDLAMKECMSAATSTTGQGDLFDPKAGAATDGLTWASASTKQAIFTALREMERDGAPLDYFQGQLLLDLGGAGLEELDLGLEAAAAVEQDGVEAEPTDESSEDDDDVGF